MTSDTTPVEGKIRVYVSDRSQAPPGATVKRDSDGDLYYDTADGYRGDPDRSFEVPVYDPEDITDPRVGTNTPETGVFDRDDWYGDDPGDIGLAGIACSLSELPVTRQEMQAIAADYKEWAYEEGPRGGDRWRNSETGEVVYDKPADAPAAPDDDDEEEEGGDEAASGDYPSHEGNYALSEGDSRRIIENDSSAQLLADSFDTDDWEFDHWSTYPDSETIHEGTVIEVDDDEFPIVGGGQTATVIDPEENIAVTEFGDRVEFSYDPAAEGYAAIRAWDDQANRVASGDATWDEYAPEYIPEEVQQNRTPENIAVDETDAEPEGEPWGAEGLPQYFEEEYGASTDGFEEGHLTAGAVELEGEFRQLNYDRLEGDIPHFIDEDNNFEYADVDGTACRYMRTDRFPGHGEVYCSFDGDVAEIDDGWYRQGDIIEREDGDGFYRELVDPDGNMTEVDLTEVGDGVIDNIYRPVEATEVASDITGVSEQFDDTYPEDPDLPDSLSPGELRNDLTDTQTDAIRSGMGKLNEVGFGDRINDVQHIEDSSFDRATEPIGMYDPVQETVHFNPEKISEEYLGGMSDDFSVGSGVEDTVVHEGVHAAHVEHLVENEGWDVNEIVDDLLEQNLDNGERMLIEEEVSEYAATNPLEVVAEIGTMLLNGEEPSEEALHLYEKYGGPTEFTEGAAVAEARRVATPVVSTKADGGAITPKEALLAEASAVRMTIHDFFTDDTVTQLSDVPVTAAEMDALTVEYKEWVPYQGPEGGDGWRNTDTDEIVYDDDPPGEIADTPQARGREVQEQATDILGDNPGRDEYAEVEAYLEDELAVENVDVSDFDAQQVETTAAELGRLDAQGDLDGLSEINSQVPEQARETYGDLPMHYDRDGEAVSINPQAMTGDMAGALAGDGVISTADAEHFLRHMVGTHKHAEAVENGDTDPEGDPSESAEQQLSEEGFDTQDIADSVGTLALATGVTLVAETWALLEGGKQPSDAALQAYRYFGGPTLSDVTGENE